jgi:hypothetical protein
VCYAGPGIQIELARAMVDTASRLGDGYSDFRSDYDFSPEYLKQKQAYRDQIQAGRSEHFKQIMAEHEKKV